MVTAEENAMIDFHLFFTFCQVEVAGDALDQGAPFQQRYVGDLSTICWNSLEKGTRPFFPSKKQNFRGTGDPFNLLVVPGIRTR